MRRRDQKDFFVDDRAATLVEFTLIAPLLFALTFGIVDFGAVFYQYQSLNAATALAARIAATRGPVMTLASDCGDIAIPSSATAGDLCSTISGSTTWSPVSCAGDSTASNCNQTLLARILLEMQLIYPPMQAANFTITYGPSGLGFYGMGKPVPMVTVTIGDTANGNTAIPASFVVMSAFGLSNITLPPFTTTLPAEDLSGA